MIVVISVKRRKRGVRMKIWKELSFDNRYIGAAALENGVTVYVRTDGSADGSDGNRYFHVARERGGMLEELGWTTEALAPVILNP